MSLLEQVPIPVIHVLSTLNIAGYEAYVVGGAVRDLYLGREPNDWDITTNAPIGVLTAWFPRHKVVGEVFGVVLVNVGGMEIQIAKFRSEEGYSDYRHPDKVDFNATIMDDLKRRDFTINAIAVGLVGECSVEYAKYDLKNEIIRAVGNPDLRFREDPLRMLRAIRFDCQLDDFEIEQNTYTSICRNAKLLENVSKERIKEEFNKILLSDLPNTGICLLDTTNLLPLISPSLCKCYGFEQNKYHLFNVLGHTRCVLRFVKPDLILRLAAFYHDIGKPQSLTVDENGERHFYGHELISEQIAREELKALKYDNKTIDEVCLLVRGHMDLLNLNLSEKSIRKLLNKYGEELLWKLIDLREADMKGTGIQYFRKIEEEIENFRVRVRKTLEEKPPVSMNQLVINGNDIMKITGLNPGKAIGEIKKYLMKLVLTDPNMNEKEVLEQAVDYFYKKRGRKK